MTTINQLDRWHAWATASPPLYRVVLATRILFVAGFLPTGLVKLLGERFTQISPDHPVGAFFEALYQTGAYWQFLGGAQVLAALLLLLPATATLGAVVFFPIILNIFVITVALDFRGTPFVTGAMLVGALGLLAWDWDRLRGLFTAAPRSPGLATAARVDGLGVGWERAAYGVGTAAGLVFFAAVRGVVPHALGMPALAVAGLAALVALAGFARAVWTALRPRDQGQVANAAVSWSGRKAAPGGLT